MSPAAGEGVLTNGAGFLYSSLMQDRYVKAERAAQRKARLRALYARAFDEFGARALWNMRRFDEPAADGVLAMTRQLRG
jgi:hypothetical protein